MGDYDFKFSYVEFQVTLGFSNDILQLVFGDRRSDFRRERESYTGSKVS